MQIWLCKKCGHEVISDHRPEIKWTDGHECDFVRHEEFCLDCEWYEECNHDVERCLKVEGE